MKESLLSNFNRTLMIWVCGASLGYVLSTLGASIFDIQFWAVMFFSAMITVLTSKTSYKNGLEMGAYLVLTSSDSELEASRKKIKELQND